MVTIDTERLSDRLPREALLDRVMGAERFLKPSQQLRNGRAPAISVVARVGRDVVGTVRLWEVDAGGRPALLLGPLAVSPEHQGEGIGSRLMRSALNRAEALGHSAVILVGDAPYYARFGFSADLTAGLDMPAPVDPARFLAIELRDGALLGASGAVVAGNVGAGDRGIPVPVIATEAVWRAAA